MDKPIKVYSADGRLIHSGKNLSAWNRHAVRALGVRSITLESINETDALVTVKFADDSYSKAQFGSFRVARKWALRKRNWLGSYWSGCVVYGLPRDVFGDTRYAIHGEYCGQPGKRFVLRFCGEFLSSHIDFNSAREAARQHKGARP